LTHAETNSMILHSVKLKLYITYNVFLPFAGFGLGGQQLRLHCNCRGSGGPSLGCRAPPASQWKRANHLPAHPAKHQREVKFKEMLAKRRLLVVKLEVD
jgi:hypothetical protein